MNKTCNKCNTSYPLTFEYYYRNKSSKDGFMARCKGCIKKRNNQYNKKNKQRNKEYQKEHYQENKHIKANKYIIDKNNRSEEDLAKLRKYWKEYKRRRHVKDKRKQRTSSREHLDKINYRRNNRILCDTNYKIRYRIRVRIYNALRGNYKSSKTHELLGCSIDFLKQYLEAQFKPSMSWSNYGVGGWHIDHIKPCASFDLSDPKQQKECFHYINLQPLWALENLRKGSKSA